jgi:hypothetical protein
MKTAKEQVRELLENLPEDATLEGIQYHVRVLVKIRKGIEEADQGNWIAQEEARRRMARWLEG